MRKDKVKPGLYRHFRGRKYYIYGTAEHSQTGETLVIYKALYGDFKVYVCPLDMFTERVDRNGYRGPRFMYVC